MLRIPAAFVPAFHWVLVVVVKALSGSTRLRWLANFPPGFGRWFFLGKKKHVLLKQHNTRQHVKKRGKPAQNIRDVFFEKNHLETLLSLTW